ncbi:glycosyltransferase family 58 protein [Suhomyces tanzawaensis NRRL Y-17324]|uniref:Dol-P-Man:Man(5)GlcNAc(2)-PP-Dol alpha-1,3-mannosyltransferase n=1 Tax=Suhomyces tanzawaensis NRRL Y-17324 TaxID=984487 RepID=A0A1E4SR30_9ASCO|nr:glycosyltransferase family 58 protein [Suhomyces tanzawaensis NRRL Y-17324]ODV81955.1 glycosyltransferase family 58 protein [Suhomyces tanzawaensis NRRL Y-17324]
MSDQPELRQQELPPLTIKNVLNDIKDGINALLYDPFYRRVAGPVVFMLTAIMAKVIIGFVLYTEIDFVTYMQQISLINDGELDYKLIGGDTGPIVYPGGYVQIYQFINMLTNQGANIQLAQLLFGYLLTFTNLLVIISYSSIANFQPWPMMLLLGSKRLFSIYVLRLFNDCFTTAAMVGVCVILQQASYWYSTSEWASFFLVVMAADLYSIAISIKMNALLYLPGFLVVAYFLTGENLLKFLIILVIIPLIQVVMGWQFLLPFFDDEEANLIRWNYINQAFDFSRQFMYKWTVNWRFVSEEFFLSREFATILLAGNLFVLCTFVLTRYLHPQIVGKDLPVLIMEAFTFKSTVSPNNLITKSKTGPKLVFLILSTSNVIGILFARSLHYQFLSWYCWQLPALLYFTNWGFIPLAIVWIVHEWCWNVFPSTKLSSAVLVSILASVLVGVWLSNTWFEGVVIDEEKERKKKLRKQRLQGTL